MLVKLPSMGCNLLLFFAWVWALGAFAGATSSSVPSQKIRPPAVAGSFYPKDPQQLALMVDNLLAKATPPTTSARLRALIAPHAGYTYSGPVAASAYAAVRGGKFSRVMVLAPSHYAEFTGIAITPAAYTTPLGAIERDPLCDWLASRSPFSYAPDAKVHVPSWQSRPPEALRPDTFEHSLEVHLPFLQRTLQKFSLIPMVCGNVDPAVAAGILAESLDDETLAIASSDLSHYSPYEIAQRLDKACVQAICTLDFARMPEQEACGKIPILIVMHLAKRFGWTPLLLDYRNSGDTSGDKARVVGYAAIAFYQAQTNDSAVTPKKYSKGGSDHMTSGPTPQKEDKSGDLNATTLTTSDGMLLTKLARAALEEAVRHHQRLSVNVKNYPPALQEPRGCFVTLTKHGELRGCIGHIFAQEPLCLAVRDNAWAAALEDPRFPPVVPTELPDIRVEVSVLTVPQQLAYSSPDDLLKKLRPFRDGVVLKIGYATATFLPQVWEQLPDKETFLAHLSRKAGCAPDAWRGNNVKVLVYEVQAFHEAEPR